MVSYIQELRKCFRKKSKVYSLERLSGYIKRNREGIWYSEAKAKGISIGSGTADKGGDILILVANNEWDQFWAKHQAA